MEEEHQVDVVRSAAEIARRALTLSGVVSVAYGDSREIVGDWLRRENLWHELSSAELAFVTESESDRKAVVAFSWQIERLVPLLWSIQKIPSMPSLTCQCDTTPIKSAMIWPQAPTEEFVATASLRREEELFDEHEKIYQAHWRVRDAKLKQLPSPDGLDSGVIYERHYGFNWVIGYFSQSWDEITTDT